MGSGFQSVPLSYFSEFPLQYCGGCHNAQKSPENFVQNTALEM